jgi:hypothetical protein
MVTLVVDPEVVVPPGVLVKVHEPEGKLFNTTLPVATVHVGWVIVPTDGGAGVAGCILITTFADGADVHPTELVTVKLYVFGDSPEIVVLVPEPEIEPGLIVQLPDGRLLSTTLPVATEQVGCVIVPTPGAAGVTGWAGITTSSEVGETHPAALVTIKL